ncbi:hypothetical protein [Wenyingzhuangia sp. IMCC45574]
MTNFYRNILRLLKKVVTFFFTIEKIDNPFYNKSPDVVSEIIYKELKDETKPSIVARFGAFDLATMVNFLGVIEENRNILNYIKEKQE